MNCMRCGKEKKPEQAFCESCLSSMRKYPVKPDAVVQLPVQPVRSAAPRKRPGLSAEERIARLRRRNQVLGILVLLTGTVALLFAIMSAVLLEQANIRKLWGKNYSTSATVTATLPTEGTQAK